MTIEVRVKRLVLIIAVIVVLLLKIISTNSSIIFSELRRQSDIVNSARWSGATIRDANHGSSITLWRRISSQDYDRASKKGEGLKNDDLSDEECGIFQSKYKQYEDLEKHGWVLQDLKAVAVQTTYEQAFKSLHLSTELMNNIDSKWQVSPIEKCTRCADHWSRGHDSEKTIDNVKYLPTRASFYNSFNRQAIIAYKNYGPRENGPKQLDHPVTGNPNAFPALSHWSDVVFLQWRFLNDYLDDWHDMTRLKAVFQDTVDNGATQEIIQMALENKGEQLKLWPGTVR